MRSGVWPALSWTDPRTGRTRRIELGTMPIGDLQPADVNQWTVALAAKPAARRKSETVTVSAATVHAHLRVLKACLNWAVAHGYLDSNPAAHTAVSVHGLWFPRNGSAPPTTSGGCSTTSTPRRTIYQGTIEVAAIRIWLRDPVT